MNPDREFLLLSRWGGPDSLG